MGYSLEVQHRAKTLFVEEGKTYEEVEKETGVSLSTLKNWGKEGKWLEERKEFERRFLSMTTGLDKLIVEQIQQAAKTKHSQDIFGVGKLLDVRAKINSALRPSQRAEDKAAFFLEVMERFLKFLSERDAEALRHLEPHIRAFADEMKAA